MAAMGVSVCGIMMMMMIMGAAAQAPAPSVDCPTAVLSLVDCLTFVTGSDKAPSAACCSELSSIVSSSPQCLCLLFNTTFTQPLGVNITLAQQLPPLCKVQTPPTSLCTLLGVPVPGPVSSGMAPTPASVKAPASAKAPATAKTPTKAPASSPKAPTPVSSSPSPSTSPAMSPPSPLASPSSPTTAGAPTGSVVPSGSTSATNAPSPAPNSAVITSKNAAFVASLLFLASIFLS